MTANDYVLFLLGLDFYDLAAVLTLHFDLGMGSLHQASKPCRLEKSRQLSRIVFADSQFSCLESDGVGSSWNGSVCFRCPSRSLPDSRHGDSSDRIDHRTGRSSATHTRHCSCLHRRIALLDRNFGLIPAYRPAGNSVDGSYGRTVYAIVFVNFGAEMRALISSIYTLKGSRGHHRL